MRGVQIQQKGGRWASKLTNAFKCDCNPSNFIVFHSLRQIIQQKLRQIIQLAFFRPRLYFKEIQATQMQGDNNIFLYTLKENTSNSKLNKAFRFVASAIKRM